MLKLLLYPFAVLYDAVTRVRNYLYDRGLKPSIGFDLPVICVGNLTVGGTGKTPMVEYLVRLLSPHYPVATLSRGYGRKTRGFRIVSATDAPEIVGDEPGQYARKFGPRVTVAVGEDRALSIPLILQEKEDVEAVILDDAFQHRRVRPTFSLLLTDFHRPFYTDLLLPAGRLRESTYGASRADAVIMTKCPAAMDEEQMMAIEKRIRQTTPAPVFFTTIAYGNPVPLDGTSTPCSDRVVLVTGLAEAGPLVRYVNTHFSLVEHMEFRDHHPYSEADIKRIRERAKDGGADILTTEKDMVKLDTPASRAWLKGASWYYLPITVQFLKNETEFNELMLNHVKHVLDKKSA